MTVARDYAARADEVRTIADAIEPHSYADINNQAASATAKATLIDLAEMYESLAKGLRRLECRE